MINATEAYKLSCENLKSLNEKRKKDFFLKIENLLNESITQGKINFEYPFQESEKEFVKLAQNLFHDNGFKVRIYKKTKIIKDYEHIVDVWEVSWYLPGWL